MVYIITPRLILATFIIFNFQPQLLVAFYLMNIYNIFKAISNAIFLSISLV